MQYNLQSKANKMTLDEIRAALRPFNLKRVAADTGLPHVTVWRFATGKTRNPTWQLVETLRLYVRSVAGDA
jgi:DNA-directed RNA polymerase specialized sigma54-like protein